MLHFRLYLSSVSYVCPCVYVYVCVYAELVDSMKMVWGKSTIHKSTIFSPSCRSQKNPFNNVFGDVVAHDRDLFLKVKDSNPDHFGRLKVIISQMETQRTN